MYHTGGIGFVVRFLDYKLNVIFISLIHKQGRPELPIGPISVDLDTFDPIITI